ncbi:hypothetical protein M3484_23150 [Pseudomonas sp. GX19020]|uniref:hypothetical protein n=1 Tax=Pseudomonas sp. GX19020 TaxID=2942277 RepID=UPI002018D061|nr:hypothetical protein [Pseudomonas sp. GX19020]MCL4069459.1 hypothetical protein [Pseudomonas sp. GX19020]
MIANWISTQDSTFNRLVAGAAIVAGLLLTLLPLAISLPTVAFWSTLLTGLVLVGLGGWSLWFLHEAADRLLLLAALWLAISPWATMAGHPLWLNALHVAVGLGLAGCSGLRLWSERAQRRRGTGGATTA